MARALLPPAGDDFFPLIKGGQSDEKEEEEEGKVDCSAWKKQKARWEFPLSSVLSSCPPREAVASAALISRGKLQTGEGKKGRLATSGVAGWLDA